MPANLTAQYHKAEEQYRRAATPEEELEGLRAMLREIPKHKGTEKLQAELKQKVKKLNESIAAEAKSGAGRRRGIRIPRQGAGTAVVLGGPNAGKSQLVATLTRATPEVAEYPFTTREPAPGMMDVEDVQVQLIDTPPITAHAFEPYMQGIIRAADVALLVVDLAADEGIEACQEVLDRLADTKTRLARESRLDEGDIGLSFTHTFLVPNKMDAPGAAERLELLHELCPTDFDEYVVSATAGTGLENLRSAVFSALDVVRVYTKLPTAKEPDRDRPFTIRRGGTVLDVAEQVHKDVAANFKSARVWGANVHDGTVVKADHVLEDQDVVELHVSG